MSASIKLFDKKSSDIVNDNITNIVAIIVEVILYTIRLFGLIIGFFAVSAGLFLNISNIPIIPKMIFGNIGMVTIVHRYAEPINIKVEDTKQIQLFVACIPKDVILNRLYITVNTMSSFSIPNMNAIAPITIVLEIVMYILANPYLISANFSSLYCGYLFFIKFMELPTTNSFIKSTAFYNCNFMISVFWYEKLKYSPNRF